LVLPIHVVLDPTNQATYIYSATNGVILNTYKNSGYRPFTYKKYVPDKFYNYIDLVSSVVANGNAIQSSKSPSLAPTAFSVAFNGLTTYLEVSKNIFFATGDFTIECWIYPKAFPSGDLAVGSPNPASVFSSVAMLIDGTNVQIGIGLTKIFLLNSNVTIATGVHSLVLNTWAHLAVVRKKAALMFFVNGVEVNSTYFPATLGTMSLFSGIILGSYQKTAGFFNGNIANLLITPSARYTPRYTVPGGSYAVAAGTIFSLGIDPTGSTTSSFTEAVSGQTFTDVRMTYISLGGYKLPVGTVAIQPYSPPTTSGSSVLF
jgi:hypothetical protein